MRRAAVVLALCVVAVLLVGAVLPRRGTPPASAPLTADAGQFIGPACEIEGGCP